jgi:hypothetical protein
MLKTMSSSCLHIDCVGNWCLDNGAIFSLPAAAIVLRLPAGLRYFSVP